MNEKAEALYHAMVGKGETLSTAESCTGGAVAASLVQVAGASEYFLGGVVAYSNALKRTLLDVSEATLEQHGVVSEPVVEEMVLGLLERTGTDWGVAISGIAGPSGGTSDKPVGTVAAAIGYRGEKPHCWTFHVDGDRQAVIVGTVHAVLGALVERVSHP